MTPDRLQEIRQRLDSCDIGLIRHCAVEDITDLLAALATAEAQLTEARRQVWEDALDAVPEAIGSCHEGCEMADEERWHAIGWNDARKMIIQRAQTEETR